jgi:hypothetical protein
MLLTTWGGLGRGGALLARSSVIPGIEGIKGGKDIPRGDASPTAAKEAMVVSVPAMMRSTESECGN